jgi:uncharacterized protein YoxC
MQTFLILIISFSVGAIAVAFIFLVRGILKQAEKITQTLDEVSHFLRTTEEELIIAARNIQTAAQEISKLASTGTLTVERIEKLAKSIQRLVDGAEIATLIAKTLKSSTAGVTSVYEGIKQGIKTLCGVCETTKGGTTSEQQR